MKNFKFYFVVLLTFIFFSNCIPPKARVIMTKAQGNCGNPDCNEVYIQNGHYNKTMEITVKQTTYIKTSSIYKEKSISNDTTESNLIVQKLAPNSKTLLDCDCSEISKYDRIKNVTIKISKKRKFEVVDAKYEK